MLFVPTENKTQQSRVMRQKSVSNNESFLEPKPPFDAVKTANLLKQNGKITVKFHQSMEKWKKILWGRSLSD